MSNLMLALDARVMLLFDAWHVKMDKRWWRASESITSSLVVTADKEQVSDATFYKYKDMVTVFAFILKGVIYNSVVFPPS